MDNDGLETSTQPEDSGGVFDASLACNCCRKRKLRCSRENPTCENCRKTGNDCVYETKRAKPGMKAGAIENLHRRLDALERSVEGQQAALGELQSKTSPSNDTSPRQEPSSKEHGLLLSLVQEICNFNNRSPKRAFEKEDVDSSRKRPRNEVDHSDHQTDHQFIVAVPPLPEDAIMEAVISAYFVHVHPWIPMIHETRFHKRLQNAAGRDDLHLVLLSMILVASRYIKDKDLAAAAMRYTGDQQNLRDWVVAKATKALSVENLQALIMICFKDIGDGEACQAWSLVGALSRIVEYLQLTIEDNQEERTSLSEPYTCLAPSTHWTEAEERRRVFWCVFNLDRFCSVTTAWNTSLTSDDVNRRLPCDGITWRKEDPVSTPYFGIWDKSAARIGNPIAFLPTHPVPQVGMMDEEGRTPSEAATSPGVTAATVDMSTVGAFAYCIEATESLSRVTSYFLQQKVNTRDQKDLSSWLTRFKELDVRLVHWKMLLPRKWKVNIAQHSSRMDPNLTLAHVTHNASMILLHQPIAFPPLNWPFRTRLPSLCSVDTCQAAAVEIATITDHYLKTSDHSSPLTNQFAFCVYVAARVLLLYWRHCSTEAPSPEFWLLIQSLDIMSKRWAGLSYELEPRENLASRYSATLVRLHAQCDEDSSFVIRIPAYTTEVKHSAMAPQHSPDFRRPSLRSQGQAYQNPDADRWLQNKMPKDPGSSSRIPFTVVGPPAHQETESQYVPGNMAPNAYPLQGMANTQQELYSDSTTSEDLGMISQMLFDSQFADMDRIISFDDGIFGTEHEIGSM
ncbi:hypothetical protein FZEAL_749 [Fusarium zealandicum]|uniref:Zn(2)-C6 fungal-type domain-containing protein n=1 Tax=Fusarium zealandicum TaxID=1053134 RepID=A0A8H4UUK2_9HYPO|nr:hypothetical protein FZEAL_749 [Fusarium zealandicum]